MPLPLAHPAAVLPLRKYSPRLQFPALVIGSLVPDIGYLFGENGLGGLSHQFFGSILFGFPIAMLLLGAFYLLRTPLVGLLPASSRKLFLPLCDRPIGPIRVAAVSVLIGIWSHILWDSFTHGDSWLVAHVSFLRIPVFDFYDHTARACHVLWYVCSFAGVAWIYLEFDRWKRGTPRILNAILLAVFVIPISMIHHLVRNPIGIALTAGLSMLLLLRLVLD